MRTRMTDEERVVKFFTDAELPTAQAVFNIVRGRLRDRQPVNNGPKPRQRHSKTGPAPARDPETGTVLS